MAEFRIPSNANFQRLNEILVGWYGAKAHESPKELGEVASRTGIDQTTISRQNKFLRDAGFLEKRKSGFQLTPLGTQYAKFIDFGQVEEAKTALRQIFREWEGFQPLFDYIDLNSPISKEDLRSRIGLAAERKYAGGNRSGIDAVITMLQFADLLGGTDEEFVLDHQALKREEVEGPAMEIRASRIPDEGARRATAILTELPVQVKISLSVNEDSDPSKLKALLRAILDAFSEEED